MDLCRDTKGTLIGDKRGILDMWAEHFGNLLKDDEEASEQQEGIRILRYEGEQQMIPEEEEILTVIWQKKYHKALGEDGITAELLKHGGREFELRFIKLIKEIWTKEEMPKDWRNAIIQPIHKKG